MKLRLLGGETEEFDGVLIIAFEIRDGSGKIVAGYNKKAEAEAARAELAARYPDRNFYIN